MYYNASVPEYIRIFNTFILKRNQYNRNRCVRKANLDLKPHDFGKGKL